MTPLSPVSAVARKVQDVRTGGKGFSEISRRVGAAVASSGVETGLANIFAAYRSCSLLFSENADPTVRDDLERWFARAVPDGDASCGHDAEGCDDTPAHIRSVLTGVSLGTPVDDGRLMLGTWQGM
jgi:secondary thiamine-phosphate synthase enzyme